MTATLPWTHLFASYATMLAVIGALDALWLGLVARRWYAQAIGHLTAPRPAWLPAALFYLGYPAGVLLFAASPSSGDVARAAALGAAFGLFCYGTYGLTNWAVMRDWPGWIVALDLGWGVAVSAAGAAAGAWALGALTAR